MKQRISEDPYGKRSLQEIVFKLNMFFLAFQEVSSTESKKLKELYSGEFRDSKAINEDMPLIKGDFVEAGTLKK